MTNVFGNVFKAGSVEVYGVVYQYAASAGTLVPGTTERITLIGASRRRFTLEGASRQRESLTGTSKRRFTIQGDGT